MRNDKLKNMIVLKDLPSNVVDEAIVILKPNVKIKKFNHIDKKKAKSVIDKKGTSKEFILDEAKMVISNYISGLEKPKREKNKQDNKIRNECKKFKILSVGLLVLLLLSFFIKK